MRNTLPEDQAHGTSSVLRTAESLLRPERMVPFREEEAVQIYQRNLPHWRQAGCTYFVTFRLADSIPRKVREELEYEQTQWLKARGIVYDGAHGSWRLYFQQLLPAERLKYEQHFNRQVQACLDRGLGSCWLRRLECIRALRDEILRHDGMRHHVGDFVIMPNHVHLLTTPVADKLLQSILKAIKGKSAMECNKRIERSGPFWQEDSHDHIVRHLEQLVFFRDYIAENPGRAKITLPSEAIYRAAWMDDWLAADKW